MRINKTNLFMPLFMLGLSTLPPLEAAAVPAMQQQEKKGISVSGTVMDENKNTLPGVAVRVKGTEISAVTDFDGHFYITVPNRDAVLQFSYIGFEPREQKVGKDINFVIVMSENKTELNEVVVTGFSSQKKLSVVGSIQTIEPTKLQVGSSRSMSNNLAGQLAGIIAVKPSGEPGYDNSNFWIRGISTFGSGSSPLVLVDGVERSLNDIDPAEIESFSVLKDASASAMYGVRGANGVILINTKRGKIAKPSVDLRVEHAIQTPTQLPEFIGAAEYMALLNRLSPGMFTADQIEKTHNGYDPDLYPNVNWLDQITKDYAYSTRVNMTVSGGSEMLRYSLTASVYNESGIMETDKSLDYDTSSKLTRYNMRANVDLDLTKTTLLRFNIGGFLQDMRKSNSGTDEVFSKAFETPPFVHPAVYSDGTFPLASAQRFNPWAMSTQQGYYRSGRSQIQSLFAIEQNLSMLTEGLKAKVTFSFDSYSEKFVTRGRTPDYYSVAKKRDDEGNLVHSIFSTGSESLGHSSNANFGNQSVYLEASLAYDRTFNKVHDVSALFLYNQRSYDWGDIQAKRTQGIAGRLSYTYAHRYIGEFNFGYNGSENFAKGARFGFFPSIAVGYVLSEEPFMEFSRDIFDLIKIRASIGKLGNDDIGGRRFAYITTINSGAAGYNWGYTGDYYRSGVQEGDYGVEDLTWETSVKANLGIELGLFNSLRIQADVFKERRSNIFMQRSTIPTQMGFINSPWANYGKVDNKGIDMSVTYDKRINKDWAISLRVNYTYAKNEIIEKDEPESVKGTYRSITGRSINTLWGYQAEGLYTSADFDDNGKLKAGLPQPQLGITVQPGDIKYRDMNGDGLITDQDQGYIGGTTDPRIVYGFGGNVTYKNVDFNFFFQGTGDSYRIIGGNDYFIPGSGQGVLGNVYSNYTDAWNDIDQSQDVFSGRVSQPPTARTTTWRPHGGRKT